MSAHPIVPWLTEARRAYFYRILTALLPILTVYGLVAEHATVLWLAAGASLLGFGTASAHTSTTGANEEPYTDDDYPEDIV